MDETVLAESDIGTRADGGLFNPRPPLSGPPDKALATGWILAMTRRAQAMTDARLAVDDHSVELPLRSIEPPFDRVEDEPREAVQRETTLPGSASRNCSFSPSPTATALD
jgi:hypothetical protein